jgi:hypothetical protein
MLNRSPSIIEVTGISGIGKTSFINNLEGKYIPYESINIRYKLFAFISFFLLKIVSIRQIIWMFNCSISSNHTSIMFKLNIFRNLLLKFIRFEAAFHASTSLSSIILVDEGVSHIPFIIQDSKNLDKNLDYFFTEFKVFLNQTTLVIIDIDISDEIICNRLLLRGHKRLIGYSIKEIKLFIKNNRRTLNKIINEENSFQKVSYIKSPDARNL